MLDVQGCDIEDALTRPGLFDALAPLGWSGIVTDGIVASVGVYQVEAGVYRCWAFTDDRLASRYFLPLCKATRAWLGEFRVARIETMVRVGNIRGLRWTRDILGFRQEGILYNWRGADTWILSRTRV